MLTKADLPKLVRRTLKSLGGEATPVEVARVLWRDHRRDLKKSGDIFYTWQVDSRQPRHLAPDPQEGPCGG